MKIKPVSEEDAMAGSIGSEVAQLRVPPHSSEAEKSVLGGLLLDTASWDRIGDLLEKDDFFGYSHRLIFDSIAALANAAMQTDVVAVYEHLERQGLHEEVGGLPYLNSLAQYVPSAGNIRRYAEIVREKAVLRQTITKCDEIISECFNPGKKQVDKIVDDAQQRLMDVGSEARINHEWVGMDTSLIEWIDDVQERANGDKSEGFWPTGIDVIDKRLNGGLRPGQLIVIAARPNIGKSALAQAIADTFAERGDPVGLFSMEMERKEIIERQCAMHARIPLSRVQRPKTLDAEDWPIVTEFIERSKRWPLLIDDKPGLNINQVRARSRKLKRKMPCLALIVVDYVQLMNGLDQRMPRHEQLGQITQGLKNLAKELQVAVILLSQIGRGADDRADGMPTLRDLKDSGAIEQDADVVILVDRPFKRDPKLPPEWYHYAPCMLAKQRNGPTGPFDLQFEPKYVTFSDWPVEIEIPTSKTKVRRSTSVPAEDM